MRRSRILRGIPAIVLLAGAMVVVSPAPAQASTAWQRVVAVHSGKCLNVQGASQANSAAVIQYTCTASATNDRWSFELVRLQSGSDAGLYAYRIRVRHSDKCLNVQGASQANSAPIIQWPCVGGNTTLNELWSVRSASPTATAWNLVAVHSGKCLNVQGASLANSARIIQYTCVPPGSGVGNDLWYMPDTPGGAFPAQVRADNLDKPVYFVHGYAWNTGGFDCYNDYWGWALSDYQRDGTPATATREQLKTVGFYIGDYNCDVDLPIDLVNRYGPVSAEGTQHESVKELGRELGWEIFKRYSRYGVPVDIVAHSMGGLIVRAMLTGNQLNPREPDWAPYVYVEDVTTLGTPHGGTPWAFVACGPLVVQCNEMEPNSATLVWMDDNPQGSGYGTDWTLIGADDDPVVPDEPALYAFDMCCVGHKISYPGYQFNPIDAHMALSYTISGPFRIQYCHYYDSCDMNNRSYWPPITGEYDPIRMARWGNYRAYYW